MLAVISPAKSLNLDPSPEAIPATIEDDFNAHYGKKSEATPAE